MAQVSPIRIGCGVLAILWTAMIFWLSSSPDAQGTAQYLTFPFADKAAHAVTFGILGALIYGATGRYWLAIVLASGYGLFDEVHQAFVPGRVSDPLDWLADTMGAFTAVTIVRYLTHRRLWRLNPVE
jgi:VanZ family protein